MAPPFLPRNERLSAGCTKFINLMQGQTSCSGSEPVSWQGKLFFSKARSGIGPAFYYPSSKEEFVPAPAPGEQIYGYRSFFEYRVCFK